MSDVTYNEISLDITGDNSGGVQSIQETISFLTELKSLVTSLKRNSKINIKVTHTDIYKTIGKPRVSSETTPDSTNEGNLAGAERGSAYDEVAKMFGGGEALRFIQPVLDRIGPSLDRIQESAKMAGSALSSVGSGLKQIAGSVTQYTVAKLKDFAKSFSELAGAFKRIIFYRMIRSIIKDIGQAFGEGVNNVYQWSKMMGGELAKSMDSIATSGLYLKNSLGAMVAPILNALAPAIEYLTDLFVGLLNAINQVFAILSGATSWTKAIKYPKEYAAAVGGAAKAAKNFGLAQIDQLTILSKANSGGGGAGGMDYSGMFEEVTEFNKKLQDLLGKMKINFNDVLFKWTNITPEDIAKKAIAGLSAFLGGASGFILGGVPGAIVGTLLGGTIGITLDSLIFDNDGQLSSSEIAESLKVALSALAGGLIGFTVGGAKGALIGASIGVSVLAGLKTLDFFKDGQFTDTIDKLAILMDGIGGGVIGAKVGGPAGAAIGFTVGVGIGMLVQAMDMDDVTGWNTKKWLEEIVAAMAPGAGALIGLTVGGPYGAALGLLVGLGITFAIKDGVFSEADKAGKRLTDITDGHLKNAKLHTDNTIDDISNKISSSVQTTGDDINKKSQNSLQTYYQNSDSMWNKITRVLWNACGDMKKTNGDAYTDMEKRTVMFGDSIKGTWDGVHDKIKTAVDRIKGLMNFNWSLPNLKLPHFRVTGSFGWSLGGGLTMPTVSVDWYGKGGFPATGEMFVARENGPEMVGSLNGHSAVANNDQIVEGIREGVYDAVTSAMASGSFNANVYLDGKQISGVVVKDINNTTRRTGQSPLLAY